MANIKYFIIDVDGTLTDGKVYLSASGELFKAFNVKDGYGLHDILPSFEIVPIIITGRKSDILLNRCRELGIKRIYQDVQNKKEVMLSIIEDLSTVAYIGDDINDLQCMLTVKKAGGVVGCPKNSSSKIIELADFISNYDGGDGAVREFIEWLIEQHVCV